jgi:hypothetical protein
LPSCDENEVRNKVNMPGRITGRIIADFVIIICRKDREGAKICLAMVSGIR